MLAFCSRLRDEHGFPIGQREARDALRAIDVVGVADRDRVRAALQLVCCGTREQLPVFAGAFDDFFGSERSGITQRAYAARHTRPGRDPAPPPSGSPPGAKPSARPSDAPGDGRGSAERRPEDDRPTDAATWQALRARYSPAAVRGTPRRFDPVAAAAMRPEVERLIASVRLGRSRRWTAATDGRRFNLRRTLRASFATGGEPFVLHALGHPPRNPRFVILIDGSRSMLDQTDAVVAFSAALADRWERSHIYVFSTALRDVTADLRAAMRRGTALPDPGDAWGGGTKIGANLARFVAEFGARTLSPQTVVIISSDGLDVGELPQLERAMREIDRRCAGIVWLNPHAATPGYVPSARGMRCALPSITLLAAANDRDGFARLAAQIAMTPRIRGRRT